MTFIFSFLDDNKFAGFVTTMSEEGEKGGWRRRKGI